MGIFFPKATLSRTIKEIGDKKTFMIEGPYGGPGHRCASSLELEGGHKIFC